MKRVDIRKIQIPEEELIKPSIKISMDPAFSGQWVVAGDLTGDGKIDFVSARNNDQEVTAVSAYSLQGKQLWTWGKANAGGPRLTYDVPLQVYDVTGDGHLEVLFSKRNELVLLKGDTGEELKRFSLPEGLEVVDSIAFANLSGQERATEIIIKSRYRKVWAYSKDWELLWTWEPKSRKTCHYPSIFDWNENGKDEILAGKPLLNSEGKKVLKLDTGKTGRRGHLDAQRIVRLGKGKGNLRIVYTYCSGNVLVCLDGHGKLLWRDTGHHFESIDVGTFDPAYESPQFYVDIDHRPFGDTEGFFYDAKGTRFCEVHMNYGRQHRHIDWTGDGVDEVFIVNELLVINGKGEVVAGLQFEDGSGKWQPPQKKQITCFHLGIWDISGKGTGDLVLHSDDTICIYLNPSKASKQHTRIENVNFTFY